MAPIQLRFHALRAHTSDVIVGPLAEITLVGDRIMEIHTCTVVAARGHGHNDAWYISPGFDPTHIPQPYAGFTVEEASTD